MTLFEWCTRRSGGLAMLTTTMLSGWVIWKEVHAQRPDGDRKHLDLQNLMTRSADVWLPLFAYYCLALHILVFIFPFRSCWAVWDITRSLKAAHRASIEERKSELGRRDSSASTASSEILIPSRSSLTASLSPVGTPGTPDSTKIDSGCIIHAIVVPNYREDIDVLRETLEILASHWQARNCYDVYLAMEQREDGAEIKAMCLANEFVKRFRFLEYTLHPTAIAGEVPGKGSNVAWAAQRLSERYPGFNRKDVIITPIDADSHLSSNYFALITAMHLAHPETAAATMYAGPIVFDRNSHHVPAIVRVADIMWSAAGISGLYQGSSIAPPTSVYSLSLKLVDRVGGWDCDSEAIGEDLHMYLKCFFALNGNLTVRTVLSPISQTNVSGARRAGLLGVLGYVRARYTQALRHMWGSLDTGFAVRKVLELWSWRRSTIRIFCPLHVQRGHAPDLDRSLNPDDIPDAASDSSIFAGVIKEGVESPDWLRVACLFHRLFEAHFLPLQTTIVILASAILSWATPASLRTPGTDWAFWLCSLLRGVGLLQVVAFLLLYEDFHSICVETREEEMKLAGLASGMRFSRRHWAKNWIDYFTVPLVAPAYGSIPCAQAQLCHFWTVDLDYCVSRKVTRRREKSNGFEYMV